MTDSKKCSQCGAELPSDAPGGHCLKCLLQLGILAGEGSRETAPVADPLPLTEKAGDRIGGYRLLQQIGEGGCGVVFMAEQEQPVRRQVALKIIKLGMDTRRVIARFEAERQALALMDHPNIAKVFDAGATGTGRPYFVMELVRGVKLTDYCDQQQLSTHRRILLFIKVCQAIQHAHQKGIIHRDLKPSNVLVTEQDGEPVPKVIDFGIAKATGDQTLTDKTLFTAVEQFIGTPAYMSPEQAGLDSLDIDTRSDVYSLGVLLYELLTGRPPFDPAELQRAAIDRILLAIREREPLRPSVQLTALARNELTAIAQRRQVLPEKLPHLLSGDLDWVVMKTLEKDRSRRYETANGLAADLLRYLKNEPVAARPPGNLYKFRKWVRRNKLAFTAASAVAAALIIGLGLSTLMSFKEQRARRQAEAEQELADTARVRSDQVAHFLENMLQGVGPSVALGRDTTMLREILDTTAGRISRDLTNQPAVEAELCATLGKVYYDLQEYPSAENMAGKALALRRQIFGNESAEAADSLNELGKAVSMAHNSAHAGEPFHREALAIRRKRFGEDSLPVAQSLHYLGWIMAVEKHYADSEAMLQEALAIQTRLLGHDHSDVARTFNTLGGTYMGEKKFAEAEKMFREALAIRIRVLSPDHPDVAASLDGLGLALAWQGKYDEAVALRRERLAISLKLYGNESAAVIGPLLSLGRTLYWQAKFGEGIRPHTSIPNVPYECEPMEEAEQLTREALALSKRKNDRLETEKTLDLLSLILHTEGRNAEATATDREYNSIHGPANNKPGMNLQTNAAAPPAGNTNSAAKSGSPTTNPAP